MSETESTDTRPLVDLTRPEIHQHGDDTWAALVQANEAAMPEPPILLRGDTLVRVVHDEDRTPLLGVYSSHALQEEMSRRVAFFKHQSSGPVQVKAPADVAVKLIHRTPRDLPSAKRVNRVIDVPVFGADETLMLEP